MKEILYESPLEKSLARSRKQVLPNEENVHLPSTRTYKEDVETFLKNEQITRTKIVIAEKTHRENLKLDVIEGRVQKKVFFQRILLFITVLALCGGGVLIFYHPQKERGALPTLPKSIPWKQLVVGEFPKESFIANPDRSKILLEEQRILENLNNPQGNIAHIAFTTKDEAGALRALSTKDIFNVMQFSSPDELLRSLDGQFNLGFVSAGETQAFMVFKSTYYESAVSALLKWEPRMLDEVAPFLDPLRQRYGLNAVSGGVWEDRKLGDIPVRAYVYTEGRVGIVYGWKNREYVIFAGSPSAFLTTFSKISEAK